MHSDPDTTGVVLFGGGAYAAYQVGVLKALVSGHSPATGGRPLRARIAVGTSAGAINAAALAAHARAGMTAAVAAAERLWLDGLAEDRGRCRPGAVRFRGDLTRYLNPACLAAAPLRPLGWLAADGLYLARELLTRAVELATSGEPLARRALTLLDPSVLFAVEQVEQILAGAIDLAAVRRSDVVLRIAATNWRTGQLRLFANADLTDARGYRPIRASAAFPGLEPVVIDGEPYVDGAYLMTAPLQPARDAGAETIHAIYMDPDIRQIPLRRLDNIIDVLDKLLHIMTADAFDRDIAIASEINQGMIALDRGTSIAPLDRGAVRGMLFMAGRLSHPSDHPPFRLMTIHRYSPGEDLGGTAGVLNFDRDHIAELIERGYRDAIRHDCTANRCAVPD
jgi:NTE family protein